MKYCKTIIFILLSVLQFSFGQNGPTLGDINQDGVGDVLDIVRMVEVVLGQGPAPNDFENWLSDINNDETTNISDIIIFLSTILSIFDGCPEGYLPCEENRTNCCLETPGSDFSWELEVLSNAGGSSSMNDVAIIDENDIWAVGRYIRSEHGDIPEYYETYNAAHWDGEEWEYIEVPVHIIGDNGDIIGYCHCNIYCVEAFGSNDIWFLTNVNGVIHWDGSEYTYYSHAVEWNENITNTNYGGWGSGPDDLYMASYLGNVFHFSGNSFEHLGDLPVPLIVTKITGSQGIVYTLAGGNSGEYSSHTIVTKIENGNMEVLYHSELWLPEENDPIGYMEGIWSFNGDLYIYSHGGFFLYNHNVDQIIQLQDADEVGIYPRGIYDMDGNNPNDIIAVGYIGEIYHFDGTSWSHDYDLEDEYNLHFGNIYKFDLKDDTLGLPGKMLSGLGNAMILIGHRN